MDECKLIEVTKRRAWLATVGLYKSKFCSELDVRKLNASFSGICAVFSKLYGRKCLLQVYRSSKSWSWIATVGLYKSEFCGAVVMLENSTLHFQEFVLSFRSCIRGSAYLMLHTCGWMQVDHRMSLICYGGLNKSESCSEGGDVRKLNVFSKLYKSKCLPDAQHLWMNVSWSPDGKGEPDLLRWVCTNLNPATRVVMLENSTLRFQEAMLSFRNCRRARAYLMLSSCGWCWSQDGKVEPDSLRWVCTNPNSTARVMYVNSTLRLEDFVLSFRSWIKRKYLHDARDSCSDAKGDGRIHCGGRVQVQALNSSHPGILCCPFQVEWEVLTWSQEKPGVVMNLDRNMGTREERIPGVRWVQT